MILTEKDVIEKGKFLIADQEAGARVPSFLAGWHDENAAALTAMLDAYIRLNKLKKLSREKMLRAKYQARAKENREAKS